MSRIHLAAVWRQLNDRLYFFVMTSFLSVSLSLDLSLAFLFFLFCSEHSHLLPTTGLGTRNTITSIHTENNVFARKIAHSDVIEPVFFWEFFVVVVTPLKISTRHT